MQNALNILCFLLTAGLLAGGLFILVCAVFGVFKFDYVLNRMHAAAMGDTLGLLFCLLGLTFSAPDGWIAAKFLLIIAFLWVASPVGSHLIARLEININPMWEKEKLAHEALVQKEREAE